MSIETLKKDLKDVVAAFPTSPVSTEELASYVRGNVLPLMENFVEEIGEMDDAIADVVHQAADVLHGENAAVFAGIIEGAAELVGKLGEAATNNPVLIQKIRAWEELAQQGREILEEIVIDDAEDDVEDEEDDDDESDEEEDDDDDEKGERP